MKRFFIFLIILLASELSFSQLGFILLKDTVPGMIHKQIKDMRETAGKKLILLGEAKDENLAKTSPFLMEMNYKGQLIRKLHFKNEVNNVKKIIPINAATNRLYGMNNTVGGISKMYAQTIGKDTKATFESITNENSVVYGDVLPYSKTHTFIIQSVRKAGTKIFNLNFIKTPNETHSSTPFSIHESKYTEMCMNAILDKNKNFFVTGIKVVDDSITPFIYAFDSLGNERWTKFPKIDKTFENLKISLDKNNHVLFSAAYRNSKMGTCWTQIWKFDKKGNLIGETKIENIKSNGQLLLKNGNTILYGTHFQVYDRRFIISKGNWVILDDSLKIVMSDEMNAKDSPDADLTPLAMTAKPTSSEFHCAIQLTDGRIALGGRVTYPEFPEESKILGCNHYNEACILFLNEKGIFRPTPR
jgi:hypothetical protein